MNKIETLKQLYYTRYFQEKLLNEGHKAYTEFGEEAITVGSNIGIMESDIISCYFRGEGATLRMKGGINLEDQMAWWIGKKSAKGFISATLPSAWMDIDNNVIGTTSSLIGADDDVAVGVAMAQKMKNTGKIVLFMVGDCAVSKGNFHETMNFASLYNLPMIIVVRSNGWGMSTTVEKNTSVTSIPAMAEPFKFATKTIDGNDVFAVIDAVKNAADYVRNGNGPYLIETITYRMSGHSANDEYEYKDDTKMKEWAQKDPLLNCEKALQKDGVSMNEIEELKVQVKKDIDSAYEAAVRREDITSDDLLEMQSSLVNKMWGKE